MTARAAVRSARARVSQGRVRANAGLLPRVRRTVTPLCPPTTGTVIEGALLRSPRTSATNVDARTTSSVVTPKSLSGQ